MIVEILVMDFEAESRSGFGCESRVMFGSGAVGRVRTAEKAGLASRRLVGVFRRGRIPGYRYCRSPFVCAVNIFKRPREQFFARRTFPWHNSVLLVFVCRSVRVVSAARRSLVDLWWYS